MKGIIAAWTIMKNYLWKLANKILKMPLSTKRKVNVIKTGLTILTVSFRSLQSLFLLSHYLSNIVIIEMIIANTEQTAVNIWTTDCFCGFLLFVSPICHIPFPCILLLYSSSLTAAFLYSVNISLRNW